MASLRQILAHHGALLLLDAASGEVQVGWFQGDAPPRWARSGEEAGTGLFRCLESLALNPTDAGAWAFCEGPGSILGVRTTAMAIRAWQVLATRPVYRYGSLDLVARSIGRPAATVIADARRETWHAQQLGQPLRRRPLSELTGELVMPEPFRHWSARPAGATTTPYRPEEALARGMDEDLFKVTDEPDAFLHEEPAYKTWAPAVHRAP